MTAIAVDRFMLARHPSLKVMALSPFKLIIAHCKDIKISDNWLPKGNFYCRIHLGPRLFVRFACRNFFTNIVVRYILWIVLRWNLVFLAPCSSKIPYKFRPDSDTNGVSQLRTVYGMLVLIIQFAMPVFCSSVCYWKIGRIIGIQVQRRSLHRIVLQESRNRLQCRKNRTNRMMITMVFGLVLAFISHE